jgi:DNA-binding beta-propeller fold protein YncE
MMRGVRILVAGLAMAMCVAPVAARAQKQWAVTKTFPLGGEGNWDYVTVDADGHRLFVTRATHTMVVDTNSGALLGDIKGQVTSHGVAIVPKAGRGFITDGGGKGAIVIFDLKTYAVLGTIAAMPDADGIIYDAKLDRVLAVSGDGESLMMWKPDIDVTAGKVETIALGGKPEFLASDGSGKVYVNLEDKDVVAVVDVMAKKVLARWPVAPAGSPVGMAMDMKGRKLIIGCRKPAMMVVMNADTGKVEATLPIGTGVDATAFGGGEAFASAGDGTLTVAAEKDGKYAVVQTVATPKLARTMGMDAAAHKIYLATADVDTTVTTGRARAKAGTFKIVVVEPQ